MPSAARPFGLEGCYTLSLDAPSIGEAYQLNIAVPRGPAPREGWPLLLVLDGERCFASCVEAMRQMARRTDATAVREMAIVAISCASHADSANRRRDFTTPPPGSDDGAAHRANRFLNFIARDVLREAGERMPVDPARRTLMGHSLSGYFALWARAARPEMFARVAAISPSIWWDRERLFASMDRGTPGSLFLAVGEWEEALAPWQEGTPGSDSVLARRRERRMVSDLLELGGRAIDRGVARAQDVRVFERNEHASIVFAAMPQILRFASA